MISPNTIQAIQQSADILDVIGEFVKLKRRGANYIGNCPFHNEKTPSFTVSPAKELFKCFGCGKSGNTIGFVMEHEKLSYVEALRWLAARYNIEVEETAVSAEVVQQRQVADSLLILNQFAGQYFSEQLWNTPEGESIALSYFRERGFRDDTIRQFGLGYSPENRTAFSQYAIQRQHSKELLLKSGLCVERNGEYQDNYRGRVIFPIHNISGKIIGFGARILGAHDKAPKYINTPENEVYVKSKVLYGMYQARQTISNANECLLVEGYTDVISLHQAGVTNTVASGGTALTTEQLRLIKKFTNNLTIVYDGDAAGIKAALRGLDMAVEEGLHVQLVLVPDKEDPDSYVQKVGAAAFQSFVQQHKKDFILFQLEVALLDAGQDSQKKATVVNQIADTLSRINKAEDFTRQQDYIKRSAELLKIDEQGLTNLVNKYIKERLVKAERKLAAQTPEASALLEQSGIAPETGDNDNVLDAEIALLTQDEQQERGVVQVLLEFGQLVWNEQQTVADFLFDEYDHFADLLKQPMLLYIWNQYREWHEAGMAPTFQHFLHNQQEEVVQLVVNMIHFPHTLSGGWKERYDLPVSTREERYKEEVVSALNYLKLKKIKNMIAENQQSMAKEKDGDELMVLMQIHLHLKQLEKDITQQLGTVILK